MGERKLSESVQRIDCTYCYKNWRRSICMGAEARIHRTSECDEHWICGIQRHGDPLDLYTANHGGRRRRRRFRSWLVYKLYEPANNYCRPWKPDIPLRGRCFVLWRYPPALSSGKNRQQLYYTEWNSANCTQRIRGQRKHYLCFCSCQREQDRRICI